MSAPAKTSDAKIAEAVRRLLEAHGEAELSMQRVAEAVGVRAPSLYKRFASRADLLSAAAGDALRELAGWLNDAPKGVETYENLERVSHLYRKFAKRNPAAYGLIFGEVLAARDDLAAARQAVAEPFAALFISALGKDAALPAGRFLVSYLHGFLSIELSKTFRFSGSAHDAFQFGLTKVLDSLLASKKIAGG